LRVGDDVGQVREQRRIAVFVHRPEQEGIVHGHGTVERGNLNYSCVECAFNGECTCAAYLATCNFRCGCNVYRSSACRECHGIKRVGHVEFRVHGAFVDTERSKAGIGAADVGQRTGGDGFCIQFTVVDVELGQRHIVVGVFPTVGALEDVGHLIVEGSDVVDGIGGGFFCKHPVDVIFQGRWGKDGHDVVQLAIVEFLGRSGSLGRGAVVDLDPRFGCSFADRLNPEAFVAAGVVTEIGQHGVHVSVGIGRGFQVGFKGDGLVGVQGKGGCVERNVPVGIRFGPGYGTHPVGDGNHGAVKRPVKVAYHILGRTIFEGVRVGKNGPVG